MESTVNTGQYPLSIREATDFRRIQSQENVFTALTRLRLQGNSDWYAKLYLTSTLYVDAREGCT